MRYVWFWTFWHWSREGVRDGVLLRDALLGISCHWDEWFHHEASAEERAAILAAGRHEAVQREFIGWLIEQWAGQQPWRDNPLVPRFVLGQLAPLAPFSDWAALQDYRTGYGVPGVAAIVLDEESRGDSEDVRAVEALVIPREALDTRRAEVASEGFMAEQEELGAARAAAHSLLAGAGFWRLALRWWLSGRRPYARGVALLLNLGWLVVAGLIVRLWFGAEPGALLVPLCAMLAGLWAALTATGLTMAGVQLFRAWRVGRSLGDRLQQGQLRLRMDGGLTLKGGSAGLAFCLNAVLATLRAHPAAVERAWLWRTLRCRFEAGATAWAATGVITRTARLKPVLLQAKLRACLARHELRHLLVPRQRDASQRALDRLAEAVMSGGETVPGSWPTQGGGLRLGYAIEQGRLHLHRCQDAAHALLAIGCFPRTTQAVANTMAVVVSAVMLVALPDLRAILQPPPAPAAVAPASPSPYYLWVSLDTPHPDYFQVLFQSEFWANRRAEVKAFGGAGVPARAELFMKRLSVQGTRDDMNGTVWVERRPRFLTREFAPGERVGHYSLSYLSRLGHE